MAHPADDRRQPVGLPVRPEATDSAIPRSTPAPTARPRQGLRLRHQPQPRLVLHRRQAYAEHAATILRTWFLDPATRMNPNLDHGQFIPCKYDGRAIGIIDFSQQYTSVLDAMAILAPAPRAGRGRPGRHGRLEHGRSSTGCRSPFGKEDRRPRNNHGTFQDMQSPRSPWPPATRRWPAGPSWTPSSSASTPQIAADGSQPQELARTRSWHYSTFDLVAYTRLAAIGKQVGRTCGPIGGRRGRACSRRSTSCCPPRPGPSAWPHPELEFHRYAASDVVHAAADAGDKGRGGGRARLRRRPPVISGRCGPRPSNRLDRGLTPSRWPTREGRMSVCLGWLESPRRRCPQPCPAAQGPSP